MQALFVFLLLPFLSHLRGIPFPELPTYLKDGAGCFFNVGHSKTGKFANSLWYHINYMLFDVWLYEWICYFQWYRCVSYVLSLSGQKGEFLDEAEYIGQLFQKFFSFDYSVKTLIGLVKSLSWSWFLRNIVFIWKIKWQININNLIDDGKEGNVKTN